MREFHFGALCSLGHRAQFLKIATRALQDNNRVLRTVAK